MPAWNEAEGLPGFLCELSQSLGDQAAFFVVDDCSTDRTITNLQQCKDEGLHVSWITNAVNSGHGPSTVKAWKLGLSKPADFVVSIDGDGQFLGSDVAELIHAVQATGSDVGEGIRTDRNDAWFRRATSFTTKVLVWTRCGTWPRDANTPLRVYRPEVLARLAKEIPRGALTPNLFMSVLSRQHHLKMVQIPVRSINRRGSTHHGSTWGNRRKAVPTKRFINFCWIAGKQWVTAPLANGSNVRGQD